MKRLMSAIGVAGVLLAAGMGTAGIASADEGSLTENGWPLVELSDTECFEIGEGNNQFCVAPGLAPVFNHIAQWWHENIDPVDIAITPRDQDKAWILNETSDDHSWFVPQLIPPTNEIYSNHGSGTAIDLNVHDHPIESGLDTLTEEQIQKINEFVAQFEGHISWGGAYDDFVDPMHFEVSKGSTLEDVQAVAEKLNITAPDIVEPAKSELGDGSGNPPA